MEGNLEHNRIYLVSPDSFSVGLDVVESDHAESDWNTSGVERSRSVGSSFDSVEGSGSRRCVMAEPKKIRRRVG